MMYSIREGKSQEVANWRYIVRLGCKCKVGILKPLKCAPQRAVNALPAAGLFPLADRPQRGRLLRRLCSALFLVYLRSTVRQTLFTGKAII